MPRKEINYSNCIIYKIVCDDLNVKELYVGSTTDFTKRKSTCKKICNDENDKSYNNKLYKMIRENGGWDNWSLILIEKYPCNDNNEAKSRERYWLETLGTKEYKETHPEPIIEIKDNYYTNNKEKYREYYEKNKEKILEQKKIYHEVKKLKKLTAQTN